VAAGLRNIEWRRANIYDNGLPEANFDYTYSRWVLVHLNRPVDAMRQLFRLLKAGSWFARSRWSIPFTRSHRRMATTGVPN
jgi:ubiquinone/menaquinone biosynthesis C-methylase UbiE